MVGTRPESAGGKAPDLSLNEPDRLRRGSHTQKNVLPTFGQEVSDTRQQDRIRGRAKNEDLFKSKATRKNGHF